MRKVFNRLSLFGKYLLLYFITAFIPAILVSICLFSSYKTLRGEVVRSNQASVKLIQQALDAKLTDLSNVITQIEKSPSLTKYALSNSPRTSLSVLADLTDSQTFVSDIILKIRDNDCYYSSKGLYYERELSYLSYIKNLQKTGYDVEEWSHLLNTVSQPTYWPVNAYNSTPLYLYLFYPVQASLQYDGSSTSRTMVLLINQNYITELFRSSQTVMNEKILLFNSDCDLISGLAPNTSEETILEISRHLKENASAKESVFYLNLDGKASMVLTSHSSLTGLYYVRFLPENSAFQSLNRIRFFIILVLILVLIVGICLILLGMKNSYVPIRTLADWIRFQTKAPADPAVRDELSLFRQVFDDVIGENESLSRQIDESRHGLIDHLLTALICGNFATEETFRNACRNLHVDLQKKYFAVCSVLLEEHINLKDTLPDFENLLELIRRDLPDSICVYVKDLLFSGKMLMIFNSDSTDTEPFYQTVGDIKTRLYRESGLLTAIGVGTFCDSFKEVGKSYLESVNALDYRIIHGKDSLITPEIYHTNLPETGYPSEDLEKLHTAFLSYDIKAAAAAIQNLSDYTKSSSCSLHTAKYICYDAFAVLKKTPLFTNTGYMNSLSADLNITHLTGFETIDDFLESLLTIVQTLSGNSSENDTHADTLTIKELLDYIGANCFSYDFQITGMAQHFGISPQYMRKLFRKHTGVGISDYIANLKLERAMYLLRNTDLNLQDIVTEIGNTDVSGMIRLFKLKTGMTPGQYRKAGMENNHGKKND